MEWQTTKPPVGQEIEFETHEGYVGRGRLMHNDFGVAETMSEASRRMREQFRLPEDPDRPFDVIRWREIE